MLMLELDHFKRLLEEVATIKIIYEEDEKGKKLRKMTDKYHIRRR